jgi:hypothetical protein
MRLRVTLFTAAFVMLPMAAFALAAGFMGGVIVWALWRFDLLQLGDRRREP